MTNYLGRIRLTLSDTARKLVSQLWLGLRPAVVRATQALDVAADIPATPRNRYERPLYRRRWR